MDFRLFGPMEVLDELGHPVEIKAHKQRALLALLAHEPGHVVSLDRLVDALWSGEPPASATGSLQVYIAQLRKALEPGRPPRTPPAVLLTREPGYLLSVAPEQVDLVRFTMGAEDGRRALGRGDHARAAELLDLALATWRGDPLAEFAAYDFAHPVTARLAEVHACATEDRFETRIALGEHRLCVPDLEGLVDKHPYRERMWGLLVLALYRSGRQADALGALRRVRELLSGELGLEPGPELRRLEHSVLTQDPSLLPAPAPGALTIPAAARTAPPGTEAGTHMGLVGPPAGAAGAAPVSAAVSAAVVAHDGLIARQGQLRRVRERLADVQRGQGGVLLVTGEAGIGKTRFAQAAADEASARGFTVAWGRCAEHAGAPAFWPWLQVLRTLGADALAALTGSPPPDSEERPPLESGERPPLGSGERPLLGSGERPLLESGERPPLAEGAVRPGRGWTAEAASSVGAALPGGAAEALFALHERVVRRLVGAAAPTLIVLDDLHWADASSLRLLSFAAAELHRAPVLVLAAMRPEPGDAPDQLRDALGVLARERGTERMALPPFTVQDVSSFLAGGSLTGPDRAAPGQADPALAEVLCERTGGNPFYLTELVRLLGSEHRLDVASLGVPEGVREVIGRRVAGLPEQTRSLLRAAAVLGQDVPADVLERSTSTPLGRLVPALEPAVATGLLHEVPDGFDYRFSHALVRDALYAELGRLDRATLHLRAGEALETFPGTEPSVLAHHFGMAARVGGAAKAVEYAVRAARRSAAQHAYDEAAAFWGRAVAALGQDDPARRCRLLVARGRALRAVGDVRGGHDALQEAIDLAASIGDRDALVAAITVFGEMAVWNWRGYGVVDDRMVALLEHLLREPGDPAPAAEEPGPSAGSGAGSGSGPGTGAGAARLGDAERAALLGTLGVELYYSPRRAEGERHAAEAVALARRVGDHALLARVLNNYVIAAWVPQRERERRAAGEEMLAIPGLPAAAEIVARVFRMSHLLRDGDLAAWDRDRDRCARLLEEARRPELAAMVRIAEAAGLTLRGRWEEAERLAAEFSDLLGGSSMWGLDFPHLVTLYACRRAQGRVGEILDRLVGAAARPDMAPLRPLAVLAALDTGDTALARDLVSRWGAEIREDWASDLVVPVWGYVSAQLGTPDPAALYARLAPYASRLVVGGMGAAGWGSTHLVLAELARATGDLDAARAHAVEAHAAHARLSSPYWTSRSARLLESLGMPS
ncbi:BTAD domain-containing putative transcriptional regulator [Nonomuraea pusilla]|uniref:BTAD domain-containing putative transcriptional regulator n=1 Tax=Nonomuraea pusilla TaxID=46177 RepID=UPI00332E7DFA